MSGSRAAKRYAKAVLLQAIEVKKDSAMYEDMQVVNNTINDSNELSTMLESPVIDADDKEAVLIEIFANQSDLSKELIKTLVANKRTSILGEVAASFMDLYKESKGIKVAHVTTAVALTTALETKILEKVKELTGSNNVTLESTIDESIIGGFILRVDDLQYNASIANNLAKIKREFNKSI